MTEEDQERLRALADQVLGEQSAGEIRRRMDLTMDMYFDFDGKPISLEEYAKLRTRENIDNWRVGYDQFVLDGVAVEVSTVWLGIDHGFGFSPVPIIYETMVFGLKGEYEDLQWRYATRTQAEAGHRRVVRLLQAGKLRELMERED